MAGGPFSYFTLKARCDWLQLFLYRVVSLGEKETGRGQLPDRQSSSWKRLSLHLVNPLSLLSTAALNPPSPQLVLPGILV